MLRDEVTLCRSLHNGSDKRPMCCWTRVIANCPGPIVNAHWPNACACEEIIVVHVARQMESLHGNGDFNHFPCLPVCRFCRRLEVTDLTIFIYIIIYRAINSSRSIEFISYLLKHISFLITLPLIACSHSPILVAFIALLVGFIGFWCFNSFIAHRINAPNLRNRRAVLLHRQTAGRQVL